MKRSVSGVILVAILSLAAQAGFAGEVAVNKWTKLPGDGKAGYVWSSMIYAPTRGQLLHWGGVARQYRVPYHPRNDVRAFDAATGKWISDYPSDPKVGLGSAGVKGRGYMLPSGRPQASLTIQGACWDSKRKQVVYTMKGLMAAYDPKTKTWKDLKAKTVMPHPAIDYNWGKRKVSKKTEFPGGPPVYGQGTCYDPVNDEIILFPHFDAKNISLREATGQISGHYGTFRYNFKDNTWRPAGDTFGSDEVKAARKGLIALMAQTSVAMDSAWVLRRKPKLVKAADLAAKFTAAAEAATKLKLPAKSKAQSGTIAGLLKKAAGAVSGGKPGAALPAARDALWTMNEILDGALRVQPPARCAAAMVYDQKNKCIVMFGGQTNVSRTDIGAGLRHTGLSDTWLYDVKTRQWREIAAAAAPPGQRIPMTAYDPKSGLVLLVTLERGSRSIALWSLDVAAGKWSRRSEGTFPGKVVTGGGQGSEGPKSKMPAYMHGFDPKSRLFLIVQQERNGQATYAMKVDLAKLPATPAPARKPAPPIKPYEIDTKDDPAWVARLKSLPVNTWVRTMPAGGEPNRRDWGINAVDPIRGWVVHFGGGHSSYQCNDVAVYPVGANKWYRSVGEQNAFVPPNEWEGSTLGHRGGPATGHQRNTYQTIDGRMFLVMGSNDSLPRNYIFHSDQDFVRFYDIDRGGVWRDLRIAKATRPEKPLIDMSVQMVDPGGRVLNLIRTKPGRYAANVNRTVFSSYDIYKNELKLVEVPKPYPEQARLGEGRPYCYLPDRDQIFFMNAKPEDASKKFSRNRKKEPLKQTTYLYDVKKNVFTELPATNTPPVRAVQVVEYAQAQKCVLAIVGKQQWVYSFEKKDWTQLPLKVEKGGMHFQAPYGQMVWVAKYGVFINWCKYTFVMRPDFGKIDWGK
jgi:Galactose oxidase, central domain